ncbi:MAG: hypothetical protein R3F62_04770 [Planctomycetota bacterium]
MQQARAVQNVVEAQPASFEGLLDLGGSRLLLGAGGAAQAQGFSAAARAAAGSEKPGALRRPCPPG